MPSCLPARPLLVLLLGLSACKPKGSASSDTQGNLAEGSAYLWDKREIPVCWQDFGDRYKPQREKVQALVTSEYARAGFQFTGWKDCHPGDKGIWIQEITDAELEETTYLGQVLAFGKKLDGMPGGVQIFFNYTISPYEGQLALGSCSGEQCLLTTALHEMGHALGLRHEADRVDSRCIESIYAAQGDEHTGSLRVGSYDKNSIMNYCANSINDVLARPSRLSAGDIATLRFAYDQKTVFPRERACKADGHAWQTDERSACCAKKEGGQLRPRESRPYLFCSEQAEYGSQAVIMEQWLIGLLGKLPFAKPGIGLIQCREGDGLVNFIPYQDAPTQGAEHAVTIMLQQPMKNNLGAYHCSSLTIYDSVSIVKAKQAVRYKLSPEVEIPIKRGSQYWNLTKQPFQSLKVKDAVIEGDPAPLALQALKAPPSAAQPGGFLRMTVANLKPTVRVLAGKLLCGPHALAVTAESMNEDTRTLEIFIPFDRAVIGTASELTCSALELDLRDRGQKPTRESEARFTFKQPQKMRMDGRNYTAPLPAASCFQGLR